MTRRTRRLLSATLSIALAHGAPGVAAQGQPAEAERPAGLAGAPVPAGNVRVEVTIVETAGPGADGAGDEIRRDVRMTVADGRTGRVVSEARLAPARMVRMDPRDWPLIVEASPSQVGDGAILLDLSIMLALRERPTAAGSDAVNVSIQDDLTVILDDGEPLVVLEQTDPLSGRVFTVEVTATVLE